MELCPECRNPLAPGDPAGLCAACLFLGGAGTELPTFTPDSGQRAATSEADLFGRYRILSTLGEGGMGTVYLAEQTRPIQRKVALKVVKPGMDSKQVLSRFNHERQAVAMMDHPNIARVYDADITTNGRPFFVMEFVDGVAITKYCDDKRLNTEQRLELFVKVCSAVQHAHGKGIIHRDIKPSNVMVTEIDGEAVPKVIDFGIAKATDQRDLDGTAFTELGQFIGTPEYMSPEQADVMTGVVDTSSDVYSLGILLYELLVGAVPFDGPTLRKAGLAELLRIVRDVENPPMQAKLSSLGNTATDIAARRATTLPELRRKLAGDLNWIVTRAVEKQSHRRYSSVSDLGADIHRHLNNEAVLASPPSTVYRASKFIRRHRLPVAAGVAVILALVLGTAVAVTQAAVANRERNIAVEFRARAEAQSRRAEEQSREAALERVRAEEQAALATRQELAAREQAQLAEASLGDVQSLANAMFGDLNDQIRNLSGATRARETMSKLGIEYLNKVYERRGKVHESPELQRQFATAYLRMGELAGDPRGSNLREMKLAHDSFERSKRLLEAQLAKDPRNSELRHKLIIAALRYGQTEKVLNEQQFDFSKVRAMAEQFVKDEPTNLQAKADLAEVLMDRFNCGLFLNCASMANPQRAVALRTEILNANPASINARWELARSQVEWGLAGVQRGFDDVVQITKQALASLDELHRDDPTNILYQRERAIAHMVLGRRAKRPAIEKFYRSSNAIMEELASADPFNTSVQLDLSELQLFLAAELFITGKQFEAESLTKRSVQIHEQIAALHANDPDFVLEVAKTHLFISAAGGTSNPNRLQEIHEGQSILRKLVKAYPLRKPYATWCYSALEKEITLITQGPGTGDDKMTAVEVAFDRYLHPADSNLASPKDQILVTSIRKNVPAMIRRQNTLARYSLVRRSGMQAREEALSRNREALEQFIEAGYPSTRRANLDFDVIVTANAFRALEEPHEALRLVRFAMTMSDTTPSLFMQLLRLEADLELDIGDFNSSVGHRQDLLDLNSKLQQTPARKRAEAEDYLLLATALRLTGRASESNRALRQSMDLIGGEPSLRSNYTQLSFIAEQLGDFPQALHYQKLLLAEPSRLRIVPPQERNAFDRIVRLLKIMQGEHADFTSVVPGVTAQEVQTAYARSFCFRARTLISYGLYQEATLEAAKSVELLRPIADHGGDDVRDSLVISLAELGTALLHEARSKHGSELESLLHKSLDASWEAFALAGRKPSSTIPLPIKNAEGKLAALTNK